MGSGDWFKTILSLKKGKDNQSKSEKVCSTDTSKSNGLRRKHHSSSKIRNGAVQDRYLGLSVEDIAAIRIQTVFRGYMARKNLRHLKGVVRLRGSYCWQASFDHFRSSQVVDQNSRTDQGPLDPYGH